MGVPCLVTPARRCAPLIDKDVLQVLDGASRCTSASRRSSTTTTRRSTAPAAAAKLFLEEYSYEAVGERVAPLFDQLLLEPAPRSTWTLADARRRADAGVYVGALGARRRDAAGCAGSCPAARAAHGRARASSTTSSCSGSRTTRRSTDAGRTCS